MKKLTTALSILVVFILSSCLDTEEKIVINKNNSGMYTITLDLSKMLQLTSSMGSNTDSSNSPKKKDTTVYVKNLLDATVDLTENEKRLYQDGALSMKIDETTNEMKIIASCPFKDATGLVAIKNNLFLVLKKLNAFEKATGEKKREGAEDEDADMALKSTNPVGGQFTFSAARGMVSSTINNLEAYKEHVALDSSLKVMKQMTSITGDFKYRTILVLPSVLKKYKGPGSYVSSDKKTITFETTLTEILEHPEKVSYKISY